MARGPDSILEIADGKPSRRVATAITAIVLYAVGAVPGWLAKLNPPPEEDETAVVSWEKYTQPALVRGEERDDEQDKLIVDLRIEMAELRAERDAYRRAAKRFRHAEDSRAADAAARSALVDIATEPEALVVIDVPEPKRKPLRLPKKINVKGKR